MGEQTANHTVEAMIRGFAARDIEERLPHLQARGEEHARDAIAKLDKRGEEEATQMRGILEAQKKTIITKEAKYAQQSAQKTLPFHEEELRQVESDRRNWNKRLDQLDAEIQVEPDRVRKVYEVRAQRIEPVGLVYLWPASSGGT